MSKKRVFIVHGWDGYPKEGWFPWLKEELEARSFRVFVPQLPKPEEPRIKAWIPKLKKVVGKPDAQTYFVGHSMGCQTIARYLETLPENIKVGGAIFVAGFFKRLTNLEGDEIVRSVVREWLKAKINLQKVEKHLPKSVAIFSDNDPYVPLDNKEDFARQLKSDIVVAHSMGHFSGSTGTKKLPIVLESLLKIARD